MCVINGNAKTPRASSPRVIICSEGNQYDTGFGTKTPGFMYTIVTIMYINFLLSHMTAEVYKSYM